MYNVKVGKIRHSKCFQGIIVPQIDFVWLGLLNALMF